MALPTKEDIDQCVCARCPSFIEGDCKLFCVNGKSTMNPTEQSCLCRTCPVYWKYHLKSREFCIRGKAKE